MLEETYLTFEDLLPLAEELKKLQTVCCFLSFQPWFELGIVISLTNDARKRPEHCNGFLILIDCIYAYIRGLRESSFNMTRGGMKILRGGSENF